MLTRAMDDGPLNLNLKFSRLKSLYVIVYEIDLYYNFVDMTTEAIDNLHADTGDSDNWEAIKVGAL